MLKIETGKNALRRGVKNVKGNGALRFTTGLMFDSKIRCFG